MKSDDVKDIPRIGAMSHELKVCDVGHSELSIRAEMELDLQAQQTVALTTLAESVKAIATFLSGSRLPQILEGYAKSCAVNGVIQGLTTHSGRGGLDARTMKQNAIDAAELIEKCFEHYGLKLHEKRTSEVDTEIHSNEEEKPTNLTKWQQKKEESVK